MPKDLNNTSEIIEMAWCDKTSFDDIKAITGLAESEVIRIMRQNLKPQYHEEMDLICLYMHMKK